MTLHRIGMIVPPADGAVPPEPPALFPDVSFTARGLALKELSVTGYEDVIERVVALARELREQDGANAISLMGTSLSFFRGSAFNAELIARMHAATGVPVTTMSDAIRDALETLGVRRVAVGTAYTGEVDALLRSYLEASGFVVLSLEGLGLAQVPEIHAVSPEGVVQLGERAAARAGTPDGILISCGGLRTLEVVPELEARTGLPVVTSATAGAWASARLLGLRSADARLGRLGAGTATAA